ncbi:hypothetical protein [Rhodopseudomonas palustris]|nr:hypothetical protein [Rhodopseudomonas palustris]AVT79923.1 hypothetical protein RPYSC3_10610 [Rhodopseudomonas palustris]
MPPRRTEPPRVTAELIAFHIKRGRALRRAALVTALQILIRRLRAARTS